MKIERVSDTQLEPVTLTKADLAERDIKLEDHPPRRKNPAAVP